MSERVFYTILTAAGKRKCAAATFTNPLKITEMVFGSGVNDAYYTPSEDQTALKAQQAAAAVSYFRISLENPEWVEVEGHVPSSTISYTLREVGLKDATGELLAVGIYPESFIPGTATGIAKELLMRFIVEFGNTANVVATINESAVFLNKKRADELYSKLGHSHALTVDTANAKIRLGTDPWHDLPISVGPKGDKGDTGATGAKGDKGDTGAKGDKGDTGATGAKGDKGDTGATGAKGDKGDPGTPGAAGAPGAKGDKGDSGTPGAAGAPGAKGDKGDPGATGAKGDKGDTGATGAKGDKGDTGATGAKGDKGDTGATGAKGDKGDTGADGSATNHDHNGIYVKTDSGANNIGTFGLYYNAGAAVGGGDYMDGGSLYPACIALTLSGSTIGAKQTGSMPGLWKAITQCKSGWIGIFQRVPE